MSSMLRAILLILLSAGLSHAEEIPSCTPARAGAVTCMSGKLCECRFERGGSITGTRDGHRWNCGVLRPACGEALSPLPGQSPMPFLPQIMIQPEMQQQQPWPHQPWPHDRRLR